MLLTASALAGCNNQAIVENYDQQVDELYNKMSQEERLAQLQSRFMDDLFDKDGKLDTAQCRKLIPNGMGHFSQYASQKPMAANLLRDRVAQLQDWLINNTPNGIPALFHEEVLTGINTQDATIYPQQIGQACSFNTELAQLKTEQTGEEMRKMGGLQSLSPMVDVCRTPSFNRLEESYGEDAYLSAAFGTAFVKGLQKGGLKKGVSTCSKHYLGYGGGGDADEKELMEEILMPHEAMIRLAENRMVMPGYHAVHGTNCVANTEILTDILRGYVGFDGVIVSDYTAIDQIPDQEDNLHRAAAAINAGNDVDFPSGSNYALLPEALEKGLVKPETFERAVKNVLRHKFRLGMFDKDAYLYSKEDIKLDSPEDRKTAYDIASQSIVLLENNGILPLDKANSSIFLTGPNANSMWAMCGDYSYPSMAYFWKKTDVGGENRDRKGIRLPGKQEQYVESLIATGKPVVLVLFGGRAMPLSEKIVKGCAAIIQAWYPGEEGGNALADILYGKVSPSAKLSVSYPNTEINEPICYNYSDAKDSRIQWPFGYGLSYSTFEYSNLKIANEAKTSDEAITLTFNIKNTGNVAADEVAQLYLSPTAKDQNIRPIQLQGFARVHLEKGETKAVTIKMYTEQFGYYTNTDGNRQWNIAPGKFTVKIGASSQDIKLKQDITLMGDKQNKPLREFYFSETSVK